MISDQHTISESIVVKGRRVPIQGFAAPGFEPVLDVFKRNFQDHQEIGAACSAYVSGKCVVDLWGGISES
jgi:hypothetical protein